MAAVKARKRPSAPSPPHHAVAAGRRARATASSASGSARAAEPAQPAGTPKSWSARRVPGRSPSFARPAPPRTAASASRTASRTDDIPAGV